MSNLNNIAITHTFNGDSSASQLVNASQLDTQLGNLAAQENAIKGVIDGLTRSDNTLADKIVRLRNLHPEVSGQLSSLSGQVFESTAKTACRVVAITSTGRSGLLTIDGVTLVAGNRVLCTAETSSVNNGIFVVTAGGGAWTRADDLTTGQTVGDGWYVVISEGQEYGGSTWDQATTTADAIVGTDALTFAMNGGAGTLATGSTTTVRLSDRFAQEWNVIDYGADPTGVADSTAAFNLATRSTTTWAATLQKKIRVPAGTYKINGTVYVRKGQHLCGDGEGSTKINCASATGEVFVLGAGYISGVLTSDAGGEPVTISGISTSGGNASYGVIRSYAAGYTISNIFMTSPGVGIDLANSSDGKINNVTVDQALTGVNLSSATNIVFSNSIIYSPNYGISIGNTVSDVTFNNVTIEYPVYSGVITQTGTSAINCTFNGCNMFLNAQSATFTGFIYSRATSVDMNLIGCTFKNAYGYSINQGAGTSFKLNVIGCVFDGTKSAAGYTQSTTAKGIYKADGELTINSTIFKDLLGDCVTLASGANPVTWTGGKIINCPNVRISGTTGTTPPKVSIRSVVGFAAGQQSATHLYCTLPYFGTNAMWRVSMSCNTGAGGNTSYRRSITGFAFMSVGYNGAAPARYADWVEDAKPTTRAFPPDISMAVCLGTAVGGATTSTTLTADDSITVSAAVTQTGSEIPVWDAELVI